MIHVNERTGRLSGIAAESVTHTRALVIRAVKLEADKEAAERGRQAGVAQAAAADSKTEAERKWIQTDQERG